MDNLQLTFQHLKKEHRIAFCPGDVLGSPNPIEFMRRVKKYIAVKPDMLEFSIPFSDPIADGPTLCAAHEKALEAGVTPEKALELIAKIQRLTNVPIFLIVYSNLILKYGIQKFYCAARKSGADAILIPDAPPEEIDPFAASAKKNRIHQILIVSENTQLRRLRKIAKFSSGFFYVVTTLGVTGERKKLNTKLHAFIKRIRRFIKIPIMIGFGISTPQHITELKKVRPDGVVVCSALVKTQTAKLSRFLKKLKKACE